MWRSGKGTLGPVCDMSTASTISPLPAAGGLRHILGWWDDEDAYSEMIMGWFGRRDPPSAASDIMSF